MTFLSRILGFIRDVVIARVFGAGEATDAFLVAFKIPNFLRRLFAEGAFSQAFVPVLAETREQDGDEAVKQLATRTAGTLGLVLLGLTVLGVLGAPFVIAVFGPGFLDEPRKYDLAVEMLRFTFPYLLFISLTGLAGSVLNSYGRFAIPAITPVILNICMIGAAILLAPRFEEPIIALALGVFAAGVAQLLFQLPFLYKLGMLAWPKPGFSDPGVRKIGRLMVPALFGVSVTQINLLLDTLIASFLVTGSVSWLYYSDRLVEFPLGVFGIALATVILPSLSKQHAQSDNETFSNTLDFAIRWVLLLGLPAALGLLMLAGPMIATLFQYDSFTAHDTEMAARSLMAYSFGLLGFILVKVLAPGFYSRQDMKTPVRIGIYAMVTNMVFNILLVFPLAHAGLALATALSASVNAALLYRGLRREGVYKPGNGWGVFAARCLVANAALFGVLFWGVPPLQEWLAWGAWDRALQLFLWIAAAMAAYFAVLFAVGIRPAALMRPKT